MIELPKKAKQVMEYLFPLVVLLFAFVLIFDALLLREFVASAASFNRFVGVIGFDELKITLPSNDFMASVRMVSIPIVLVTAFLLVCYNTCKCLKDKSFFAFGHFIVFLALMAIIIGYYVFETEFHSVVLLGIFGADTLMSKMAEKKEKEGG